MDNFMVIKLLIGLKRINENAKPHNCQINYENLKTPIHNNSMARLTEGSDVDT